MGGFSLREKPLECVLSVYIDSENAIVGTFPDSSSTSRSRGVSIGLGTTVIFAAAKLVRPLAASRNVRSPEED